VLILSGYAKNELVIKNSRFIAEVYPVESASEARALLASQKERYADAGHVVHAFIVGPSANVMGCSDDGEPPGTAGRPAMEVLKGSGITNLIVTITRYFGGIKLGTGGLVKAYTESVQEVLAIAPTREDIPLATLRLDIPYPLYEQAKRLLDAHQATIGKETFTDGVHLEATLPADQRAAVLTALTDLSRGKIRCQPEEEEGIRN
jgi:uncharacterized YigZ family protein